MYVLLRATDESHPRLRAVHSARLKAYEPTRAIKRAALAAVEVVADHRDCVRGDRSWKKKIATLRKGLAPLAD